MKVIDTIEGHLANLLRFLAENRPKTGSYQIRESKKFYKVVSFHGGEHAYCFISKESRTTKYLGEIKQGDLLYPASWTAPAKHSRGSLFDPETWELAFEEWGMKTLPTWRD